jgi:hypothetical protein
MTGKLCPECENTIIKPWEQLCSGCKAKEIILEDSPEAATYQTGIEGWVSRDGRFWGKDERMARYDGSTHRKCEKCGGVFEKNAYCRPCWEKRQDEKYAALERVEWDGESPVCSFANDQYFFNGIEEVQDYCDEHGCNIEDLQLCHCEPMVMPSIDVDSFFENHIPDTYDADVRDLIDQDVLDLIDDLNDQLEKHEPISWQCSDKAVKQRGEK